MKIAIVTDAWHPQVNGVATTLDRLTHALTAAGHEVRVIGPGEFPSLPVPGEPGLRLALASVSRMARLLESFAPEALHIATEGPLGWRARSAATRLGLRFTSAYHTCFPEYAWHRYGLSPALAYAVLRRFHAPSARVLVPTPDICDRLQAKGFERLAVWGRGVDAGLFRPSHSTEFAGLPRPIFLSVGRLAREKNLEAFLQLSLPGSKVVIGDGPAARALAERYPQAHFLGAVAHDRLPSYYAAADAFVFPSRTDTFGLVLLEAMACGTPVAAFPEAGPRAVVVPGVGAIDEDLRRASLAALECDRTRVREHAERFTWSAVAGRFVSLLAVPAAVQACPKKRSPSARLKRMTASWMSSR